LGVSIVFVVRWVLFNLKARFIFRAHIPLTPGVVIKKRDWIFDKVRSILHDYLAQAENIKHPNGYLKRWEKLIFETAWEKAEFIEGWKLLPKSIKEKIHAWVAQLARDLASKLLRQFIPKLAEQLRIEQHIDDFDAKYSNEVIRQYYNRYVHKYLLYFFLGINLIIGFLNMILFWFIG
jgi:uncharacterized membrane protein YheB (UPF0754 family)